MGILDWFFPRRCLGCRKAGFYFCPDCREKLVPVRYQTCPVCGRAAIGGFTHFFCRGRRPLWLDGSVSVFPYGGMIKAAIGKLKYHFVTDLSGELAELIKEIIVKDPFNQFGAIKWFGRDIKVVLIPIPLHPRRYRWRGFNQSELLGKQLAAYFGWKIETRSLIRRKPTKPQAELKSKEREKNIAGAFDVNTRFFPPISSGILLFDDVWTTGSTMNEACQTLKKAGFKRVWGLTVAR